MSRPSSSVPSSSSPAPDHQRLAFIAGGDLFVLAGDGSGVHLIYRPNDGSVEDFAWSPDGRWLSFDAQWDCVLLGSCSRSGTFVADPNGTGLRQSTRLWESPGIGWSPDGDRFAFPGQGLWVEHADGSGGMQLTARSTDASPAWSPDGREIAFVREVYLHWGIGVARFTGVDVVRTDGTHLRALTAGAADDSSPSWSADGAWIAFDRVQPQAPGRTVVYAVSRDGSRLVRLSRTAADGGYSWSPDGSLIAVDEANGIYVERPDGTDRRLLVSGGSGPSWSPDGSLIAYWGAGGGISVVRPDGTDRVELVALPPQLSANEIAWAPR